MIDMGINRVTVSGNLTRDPELRATNSGLSVLNIGMAVNDRRKNQETGQWEDQPNFVDVTVFGARADALSSILSKGFKIAVDGKLRWSQWENKQGERRSKLEIIADEIELMTARGESGGSAPYSAPGGDAGPDTGKNDEEIPF